MKDPMTVSQAARYLNYHEVTTHKFISDGYIPSRLVDGRRLVERADLDKVKELRAHWGSHWRDQLTAKPPTDLMPPKRLGTPKAPLTR